MRIASRAEFIGIAALAVMLFAAIPFPAISADDTPEALGSRGTWQVRPPIPRFEGATWMQ